MTIDVGPLIRGEVSTIAIDFLLEPELPDDAEAVSAAHVWGNISGNANYMRLMLQVSLPYRGVCARCLAPVEEELTFTFERTLAEEGTLTQEQLDETVDEYVIFSGSKLNVDEELRDAVILEFPMRLLCDEDCPGLCPKCGKPRREGKCDCPEKEIDPRWAALAKFRATPDPEDDSKNKK